MEGIFRGIRYVVAVLCFVVMAARFSFCSGAVYSQEEAHTVDAWCYKLIDTGSRKELIFDSAVRYAASIASDPALYKIRYAYAYSLFAAGHYQECSDSLASMRVQLGARKDIPVQDPVSRTDSLWYSLYLDIMVLSGQAELYLEDYVMASDLFTRAMQLYGRDTLSMAVAKCYNGMGAVMAYMQMENEALDYMFKALEIVRKLNDYRYRSLVSANISAVYYKSSRFDLALKYALESYESIVQVASEDPERYLYTMLSLALSYQGTGNYSQSEKYYTEALEKSQKAGFQHIAIFVRYNYMILLMDAGRYAEARRLGEYNLSEIRQIGNRSMEMNQLERLAILYERSGQREKEIEALKCSHALYVEINSQENAKKLSVLQQRFDMYRSEQEKVAQQQRLDLMTQQLENKNLWLAVSVGFGLILLVAIFFLSRRIFYQCKVNALMKKRLDQTLINASSTIANVRDDLGKEIYLKNKELTSFALYSVKIGNIVDAIVSKVRALKLSPAMKPKERLLLGEVDSLLKQLSPDKSWREFEMYFQNVDQAFFKKLEQLYPDLTPNERRLCALISLNLNSKEIATLTNRTSDSINTAKTRLKRKMNIEEGTNLYTLLSRL